MRTRLVSFLGLGPREAEAPYYSPVIYELDGRRDERATPLFQRALVGLIPEIESVVVLGTSEVEERWIESGLFGELLRRPYWFQRLPTGVSEEERWGIFDRVIEAMAVEPIAAADETSAPEQIVVDVTHGFRAQPLLGMAAVGFVLSEWARAEVEKPPVVRILYGAFDAGDSNTGVAPVWDLTEFVAASRWNAALDAFMRFGRADDLEQLGEIEKRASLERLRAEGKQGAELQAASQPSKLGSTARKFADDLALGRLRDIVTGHKKDAGSAERLLKLLSGDQEAALERRLPPIRGAMEQLRERLSALSADRVFSRRGLEASLAVARLYLRLQRFAELAAVLREAMVTWLGLLGAEDATAPEPGQSGCHQARLQLDQRLGELAQQARSGDLDSLPEALREIAVLASKMVEVRNDIEHCGLNDQPAPASSLRSRLQQQLEDFELLFSREQDVEASSDAKGGTCE